MINKSKKIYHYVLAWLGKIIYGNPSKNIFVLGVTGTKGKSTVVELINAIMEAAGKKIAIASSLRFKIGEMNKENRTGMTMPGRFFLQSFLKKAVEKECQYVLMEVTSQGIDQYRDHFISFDAGLLTNLQPEHIEAHGSFEKYRGCKINFFKNIALRSHKKQKLFFINREAKDSEMFAVAAKDFGKVIYYSKKDLKNMGLKIKLLGDFNLENIAAAVAFTRSQHIDWEVIKNVIENFDGVPGRLEFVQKSPFSIVIDYAHTPDSLENVYETIKKYLLSKNDGRLICVLGSAGGGRDIWKRPVMGKIASKYCDEIILTNEDPFDDDPEEIINQIAEGVVRPAYNKKTNYNKNYTVILDRREAIKLAISSAKKDDVVVITGKGCEPYMRLAGGKRISWNEREIALEVLRELKIEI